MILAKKHKRKTFAPPRYHEALKHQPTQRARKLFTKASRR